MKTKSTIKQLETWICSKDESEKYANFPIVEMLLIPK